MTLTNLLRHISLKRLKLQKAQALMTVSGICLGVSAIVSIGIVNKSVIHSFEDSITRVTGRASLQVSGPAAGFPEALVEHVQDVPGVEYAAPVIETKGLLAGAKEESIMILGVDVLLDRQIRDYQFTGESADIPDPLLFLAKPDSILLTREMAEREGIKTDQAIRVQTVHGIQKFRVRGLLNPEGPAKAMGGNIAVMDIFAAQTAFGKEGRIDRIDVSLRKGEDLDAAQNRIRAAVPEGYRVETPAGRSRQIQLIISHFQKNINVISFIAVFVGMYLIYNAVSISVVSRRKEIGILRALGTTRGQIIRLFLGETLVNAVIGSGLGIALGILFARAATGTVGKTVSELYVSASVTELEITWFQPAIGFATGISASLAAALFPALSASRITPISAIRSVPYSEDGFLLSRKVWLASLSCVFVSVAILMVYKTQGAPPFMGSSGMVFVSVLSLLLGISLATPVFLKWFLFLFHRVLSPRLGAVGRLAGLNLQKNLGRNAVAAAAIFYGISVFVSSIGILASTKASIRDWVETIVRGDIIVTSGHPLATPGAQNIPMPADLWKEIEKVPGVLSADPYRRMYLNYDTGRVLLAVLDIKRRMEYTPFVMAEGSESDIGSMLPGRNNVAVSEAIASRYRLKTGDTMLLSTPDGPVRFGVAGVTVDYRSDSGTILMDLNTYQRHWKDFLADSFSVRVKEKRELASVREAIVKRFGSERKLFVLPAREYRNEIGKVIDQAFIVDHAVNVITLLIAGLGIIVTLLASVLERTREIGILRSLGMLRAQVSRVVVLESMLLGVVGGALGVAAGILTGWMSMDGFLRADYGASMRYHVPSSSLAWALALSVVFSALSGIYPARRAAKTNIMESLAYE